MFVFWSLVALTLVVIHSPEIHSDDILVPQTKSDENKNAVYMAELEECLNLKNAIPNNYAIKFNVTKVSDHINILVYDDGKFDYFELNPNGKGCFTAVRMDDDPTRKLEEQMECDDRSNWLNHYEFRTYNPLFSCGYEVVKNETFIVVLVQSMDGVYKYNIDRITGKAELYLYNYHLLGYDDQVDKCVDRKYSSDFDIPLEVTPMNLDNGETYLHILVEHQGKYDLYVTEKSGHIRHTEINLPEKPQLTLSDYEDKLQCQPNGDYYGLNGSKKFRCPLKVIENENYVNISLNAFHYENIYVVDKLSNDVKYVKVKDNLVLTHLPIPDAELNFAGDFDECITSTVNTTEPFPIDVVRYKDFLQIIVSFNGTALAVFDTDNFGRECPSDSGKSSNVSQSLADVHPECVNCDGPAFAFFCPNFIREEDEDTVSLQVYRGIGIHSYTLTKSTGEVQLGIRAMMGPAHLPPLIISLIG